MTQLERRRITYLILKKICNKITKEEKDELDKWSALSPLNQELVDDMMDDHTLMKCVLEYAYQDTEAVWTRLTQEFPALATVSTSANGRD